MLLARMAFLKGKPSARGIFTAGSEENLTRFAGLYPDLGVRFLKTVRRLGSAVETIVFPEAILEFQNRGLVEKIHADHNFAKSLVKEGVFDLRKAGYKSKPGCRDLTKEFEEYRVLDQLRASFQKEENLEILKKDAEISNLTLYYNLWMVRVLLYKVGEQKSAAKRDGNLTILAEARDVIAKLSVFLKELAGDFPIRNEEVKGHISNAIAELVKFNNPTADAALAAAAKKLEDVVEKQEKTRIFKERRSSKRPPKNIIEEELVHLAQRRYKISFSSDGAWIIPEGGFRRMGPALQKQIIPHRVALEKVVRREQHKLDEISQKIAINADFRSMLEGFDRVLRSPNPIDYEQVTSVVASSYLAYEKGKVRPKFKVKLLLRLALELVKTAELCHEEEAQKRLQGFAGTMLKIAAAQLDILNQNLGNQLRRIAAKQKLQMEIIRQNMVRDASLRSFSQSVLRSITNQAVMNLTWPAWKLRELSARAREVLRIREETEEEIKRCAKRIGHLTNLFAKIGRMINEKEKFRESITSVKKKCGVEAENLRASGKEDKIMGLKARAVEVARENLSRLASHNEEIALTLAEIAREALLIQYDVENKGKAQDPEEETRFIEEHTDIFNAIAGLNERYYTVLDFQNEPMGRAHRFDVKKLKLKTLEEDH